MNKENKTQNIWILGSQSFLAKSFSKLLESENINFTVFNSKETGYSYEVFEESFLNDLPNIIIDFKFPIVNSRSNNKSLQTSEYFSPQKNLAEVLKKYNYSDNLFLISTNLKNNEEYKKLSDTRKKSFMKKAIGDYVSQKLHNTPSICRSKYINNKLLEKIIVNPHYYSSLGKTGSKNISVHEQLHKFIG